MNRFEKILFVVVAALGFTATLRCGPPGANAQSMNGMLPAESNRDQWRSGAVTNSATDPKVVIAGPLVLTHLYNSLSASSSGSVSTDATCQTVVRMVRFSSGDRVFLADGEWFCGGQGLWDYSGFIPYKP